MKTELILKFAVVENEATRNYSMQTEIEVTADTDEDSLDELLDNMREMIDEIYDFNKIIKFDWNSKRIFAIADSLM